MNIQFVAGFGPIVTDVEESLRFWEGALGLPLEAIANDYHGTDELPGVKAFALWPLKQAAMSVFGEPEWPGSVPSPQAWLELDVGSTEEVGAAVDELTEAGHRILRAAADEPWGQTTARLLSPDGLLIGITYTPWMHQT